MTGSKTPILQFQGRALQDSATSRFRADSMTASSRIEPPGWATAVIPASSKPEHQIDNLKAGRGPLLSDAQQRQLAGMDW